MNTKFRFSDQPRRIKIIYAAVISVLCVTAVIIGIVSAAQRKNDTPIDDPVGNLPNVNEGEGNSGNQAQTPGEDTGSENNGTEQKLTFVSPVVGEVTKHHSIDTPVFSNTLNEWRVHTGIDISADEGAEVFCSADGVVTKIYSDPLLGKTVEVTHEGGIVSTYSNLATASISVSEGDEVKSGALLGKVGDTSLSELADEAHLHFGIKVNGVSVNPLDYISEDSKQASLGITEV